ncbi:MAG: VOC family protein [Actinomycetota bacterium]|nr:VOC family protein [Actinomycetota bacterium]
MAIQSSGYAHVRLTVTDIVRSRAFYDDVFGFEVAMEVPADADEATRKSLDFLYGGVLYKFGESLFGLRPAAPGSDRFHEDRVGLDHLSFAVASRDDLDAAASALDAKGIAHEAVKNIGPAFILEFRDPDGIALELLAPAG